MKGCNDTLNTIHIDKKMEESKGLKKKKKKLEPRASSIAGEVVAGAAGHALEISHLLVRSSLRAFLSTGRDGSPLKIEAVCSTRVSYYAAIIDKPAGVRLFLACKRFFSSSSSSFSMHFFVSFVSLPSSLRANKNFKFQIIPSIFLDREKERESRIYL